MTELEQACLAILTAKADAKLSSRDVHNALPRAKRPKGKNSVCIALQSLVALGHAMRHGGSSKKFARYSLMQQAGGTSVYAMWPFTSRRDR